MPIERLATQIESVLPDAESIPMPVSHVTNVKHLDSILRDGKLTPTRCTVFQADLLYLFYGGVFHRPSNSPTRDRLELPVAFLFHPTSLDDAFRYFPFDTGGVAARRFKEWREKLAPVEETFAVNANGTAVTPSKIVSCLFKSNAMYLKGRANPDLTAGRAPLPLLYEFYEDDGTPNGADLRQHLIECQFKIPIPFDRNLLWLAFPEELVPTFARIYDLTKPHVPKFFPYEYHSNIVPSEIVAKLETEAYKAVIKDYVMFSQNQRKSP